jgi:hypothetical protein
MDQETIEKCLVESSYIDELVGVCDSEDTHYVVGLLAVNDLDPDDERYEPLYLLHDILTSAGEMSDREALVLMDNVINEVIRGIAESVDDDVE